MNEIERVANMVADGRITADEGDRLIAVLRSVAAGVREPDGEPDDGRVPTETTLGSAARVEVSDVPPAPRPPEAPRAPLPPLTPVAPAAPVAAAAEAAAAEAAAAPEAAATPGSASNAATAPGSASQQGKDGAAPRLAPAGIKWLRVEMLAGDLEVAVDPRLAAPTGRSGSRDLGFEPTPEGYRLTGGAKPASADLAWLGLGNVLKGDFSLRLPPGYGVELAKTAGDIELHGVEYLRGTLAAGDLDAHGLKGVDLDTLAGDVDIRIAPTAGRHRVHAKAGEVTVVLLPGSDVTVTGNVSVGDIEVEPPFETERRLVGERFEGTVGAGTAALEVKVIAGNIVIRRGGDHE